MKIHKHFVLQLHLHQCRDCCGGGGGQFTFHGFMFHCSQKNFLFAAHTIENDWSSWLESSGKKKMLYGNVDTVVENQRLPILQFDVECVYVVPILINVHLTFWLDIIWLLVIVFLGYGNIDVKLAKALSWLHKRWGCGQIFYRLLLLSIRHWMGPYQRTPLSKLRSSY